MSASPSSRRRASRFAIFAAVVAAHLLALHFFPDFRPPPEASDREPSLPVTLFPEMQSRQQRPAESRPRSQSSQRSPRRQIVAASSRPTRHAPGEHKQKQESAGRAARQGRPRTTRPWIDWEKEADTAVAEQSEEAAQAARRASALSRWREHVMPGPAPRPPEFRWDEARTSQRFVPTIGGLLVHLNDRCVIIVSPLALFGGCAIGEIPVYGDLFAHMDDPKEPGDTSVPQ